MSNSSRPLYCPLIQQMVASASGGRPSSPAAVAGLGAKSLAIVVLHGLVSSLGILENLLVLGVVGLRVRRTVFSVWILNLAASDLLATSSLPFFTLHMARGNTWTLGTVFCRLHASVFFLNMFVSGFLLAAISLDRCLMVLRPVWARNRRSVRLVSRACGLIWALAVLCTVPFYVFRDTIRQNSGQIICYYNYARHLPDREVDLAAVCQARQEILAVAKLLLAFLLPLAVIIGSYVTVAVRLARRGHRRSFRFVHLVVAVVVSFVVCWAPYHLFSVLEAVAPRAAALRRITAHALPLAASLAFLNSVLNPVLYVFSCPDLSSTIRQSLTAVLESALADDRGEPPQHRGAVQSTASSRELVIGRHSILPNAPAPTEEGGGEGEEGEEEVQVERRSSLSAEVD